MTCMTLTEPLTSWNSSLKQFKGLLNLQDLQQFKGLLELILIYCRWDKCYMRQLPDYMKLAYGTLLDTIQLLEQDYLANEGRGYAVFYLQQPIRKELVQYFSDLYHLI